MNINKITETIFNSSLANLKISVECAPERNSANGPQPLVTVSDRGVCSIDSSIYLVFSYKSQETTKNLYMSYPQIPQLINIMAPLAEAVSIKAGEEGSAFGYIENTLVVHPNFSQPSCIANIGKRMMGLSLRVVVADLNGSNGVPSNEPAIEIRITDPEKTNNENALASVLSVDEFLNIVHLVKTINLAELNAVFSLFYLQNRVNNGYTEQVRNNNYNNNYRNNGYNNYNNNGFQQNQGNGYQNNYQQNNYQDNGPAPRNYGNNQGNNRPYNNRPQQTRQAVAGNPTPTPQQSNFVSGNNYNVATSNVQPQQPQVNNNPAPTTNKIMNNRDIENTPISTITFDDAEEIDQLFSED